MRSKVMFMILVILVFLVACGKKEEPAAAGDNAAIQSSPKMYSQLPSFKDVFKVLSEFDGRDIAIAVPETQFKTATKDIPKGSFSLGTLTADAILAVRTRNKSKLMDISKEMLALSSLLGLDQEINQMADEIRTKIEKEQWDDLEASLESLKGQVEDKLYGLQDGDSYTFMLFGGWNEAINKISSILSNKFDPAKTVVLSQKGT
ncbi:MAG: hypothetical protein PHI68_05745, partial [Candidatus Cloacimonetes bacterium]|nr:hypothetical protein [Candidatus Cloacimonadota bacterium]